jgi:phosphate transport system protein
MIDRREGSVRELIDEMFDMVEQAVENALVCVASIDSGLAQQIIDGDAAINALYRNVEDECVTLIARMQPMARDLRELVSDMQIAAELERIADYASAIAGTVQQMQTSPAAEIQRAIAELGEQCTVMLANIRKAYDGHDSELARKTAALDDEVDSSEQRIIRQVFTWQGEHPGDFISSTHALWIAHSMERIGDRVTNIAERVVYIATSRTEALN